MKQTFSINGYLEAHKNVFNKLDFSAIEAGIMLIKEKFQAGKKIITCGNGGSAFTASHYITDWNKMVHLSTGRKFRGISLCDNIGLITAFANDMSYTEIFSGQLAAILDEGDLVIAVSGSGNSPNVISAVEFANSNGADTLGILGYDGGKIMKLAKATVLVPSFDMQICEDIHLMFGHMVMKSLCKAGISADH